MVDLHTHTTVSDGTLTPTELLMLAKEIGLKALALTDHDNIGGIEEARTVAAKLGIEFIAGVELDASVNDESTHLLGLFIDEKNEELQHMLELADDYRAERNRGIIDKLKELNLNINTDSLVNKYKKTMTRGHVAIELIKNGYASELYEAMEKYMYKGAPAYTERRNIPTEEIIKTIHNAGGIVIIAHVNQIARGNWEKSREICNKLVAYGVDGIETIYPQYDDTWKDRTSKLADDNGLIKSGGSDFHGDTKPGLKLGVGFDNMRVDCSVLAEMKKRLKK